LRVPQKCVSNSRRTLSRVSPSRGEGVEIPALLMRMSSSPTRDAAASMEAASVMSRCSGMVPGVSMSSGRRAVA
jgi:hypothetical protein